MNTQKKIAGLHYCSGLIKWLFCTFFMAFIVQGVSAQKLGQQRIDSLLAQMPALKEDTNMVKLLGDLSYTYYRLDADKGLAWGEKALALATKLGFKKGEARAYSSLGSNYYKKHNYIMAQDEHLKALTIDQEINEKWPAAYTILAPTTKWNTMLARPLGITNRHWHCWKK
jgi:tetratricopeptide (TPR) repeat protein